VLAPLVGQDGTMDHYGLVVTLGDPADAAPLNALIATYPDLSPRAYVTGVHDNGSAVSYEEIYAAQDVFSTALSTYHVPDVYLPAVVAYGAFPAAATALQDTSADAIVTSIVDELPQIVAQLPAILAAGDADATAAAFQASFADVATELMQATRTASFADTLSFLSESVPDFGADFPDDARLEADLLAVGNDVVRSFALTHTGAADLARIQAAEASLAAAAAALAR